MHFERSKLNRAVLSAIAMSAAGSVAAQTGTIEEVVVTATKRAQSAEDIPVSVQAMTGDDIDELGVDSFDEYVQYLSNVVSSGRGPGRNELFVRGAATEQSALTVSSIQGTSPGVALYQDEQPVSFAARNLDVYATDLARIEVLPGPQGTLFGASSQTGTVRLITNKPQHDGFDIGVDTRFSLTKGGDPSTAAEAFLNMPLSEQLAFRVAAYNDRAGGWIDNAPGLFTPSIEVINRNQISSAAAICTGKADVDNAACGGQRARMASADNSQLVEDDFNEAVYAGARFGVSYLINDDWDLVVQHTEQSLEAEGVFEYDPVLADTKSAVNRFAPSRNEDDFGLTTWTLTGRLGELDAIYTGGFLDRDVFYVQDYTGYTVGGGYQAYYVCTGGYSNATQCFDPAKQYVENTASERLTHEFRISTDPARRWRITAGVFLDDQKIVSDGQFQYPGAVDAGFNAAAAPGTVTDPANSPPGPNNIVSTVDGVSNPYGRGPQTIFVNNFTREEEQVAFFGEFSLDLTDRLSASFGVRDYDLDLEFTGSTGSSFGCKGAATPCDGQGFDNRVSRRLEALGAYNESGNLSDLTAFFSEGNAQAIADGVAQGTFYIGSLNDDGVIQESDTIFRATVDFDITDDAMVFAAWSEGFRPQTANRNAGTPSGNQSGVYEGYLVPAIARTDKLENFEIGLKGTFLERTLQINATAYTTKIDDLQTSRFDPANVAFLVFIENAGDADVDGLDVDFTWLATPNLTLNGGLSYVDNKLTRINPQLEEVVVPVGSRLPWTPKLRANLRARYDFRDLNLMNVQADAYVRGAITYTGDSRAEISADAYLVEDVATQVFGNGTGLKIVEEGGFFGLPLAGDDLASVTNPNFVGVDGNGDTRFKAARYVQKGYTFVNLAAGLQTGSWGAELFVDNVLDKNAQINVNAIDYTPSVTTNRPRTIGVRFTYDLE
ncbi:MAG: TonB-dependent receptor [Gammaproteobacteria bacterium]|nr:TonB-dependent receptor [Gammaproteobacteria bacterium]